MARVIHAISVRGIQSLIRRLPERQFLELAAGIEDRAETLVMMKTAETGFRDWNEKGEDIYDDHSAARRNLAR